MVDFHCSWKHIRNPSSNMVQISRRRCAAYTYGNLPKMPTRAPCGYHKLYTCLLTTTSACFRNQRVDVCVACSGQSTAFVVCRRFDSELIWLLAEWKRATSDWWMHVVEIHPEDQFKTTWILDAVFEAKLNSTWLLTVHSVLYVE